MLFIRLTTTKTLTLKQEKSLQESVHQLMNLLLENELMLHIEDNQLMYYQDGKDCMRIECYLMCHDLSCQKEFIKRLKQEIEKITCIPFSCQSEMIIQV